MKNSFFNPSIPKLDFCIFFNRIDGELRTNYFAIMAIYAVFRFFDFRRMVAFLVEPVRKNQDFFGAEFDTISAPFAAIIKDMYDSSRDLNVFHIQWGSPERHGITRKVR